MDSCLIKRRIVKREYKWGGFMSGKGGKKKDLF